MKRITQVKYQTKQKPTCPDEKVIIALLESIGYRVARTYPQWGGVLYVSMTDATAPKRKNKGKVVRKIRSMLPLKAYDVWTRRNRVDGQDFFETVIAVEMDRSRSIEGINDLLSTYEVSA